jgi:single-strand DNA-binding protein
MLALDVDDIGPSLRFATATITKAQPSNGAKSAGGSGSSDPWNTAPANSGGDSQFKDAPPF